MVQTAKIQKGATKNIALQHAAILPGIKKKRAQKPEHHLLAEDRDPEEDEKPDVSTIFEDIKAASPHETLAELLDRIFKRSAADNHYIVTQKPLAAQLATVVKAFPVIEPKADEVILQRRDQLAEIKVRAGEITFVPKTEEGAKTVEFTKEDAYAMALIASRDPEMLENGVELTGTPEQQKLLRAAIAEVNLLLPQGKALTVQGEDAQPALKNAQRNPENIVQDAAPEAVADARIEEPKQNETKVEEGAAQPAEERIEQSEPAALPEVAQKRHLSRRLLSAFSFNNYDAQKAQKAESVALEDATGKAMSRRNILKGGLATAAVAAAGTVLAPQKVSAADLPEVHTVNQVPTETAQLETSPGNPEPKPELLQIYNTNTGKSIFIPLHGPNTDKCRDEFNRLACDSRTRQFIKMDPRLLQRLCDVTKLLRSQGKTAPMIMLNSGYRTKKTNRAVGGVPNSLHIRGQAMDFWIPETTVDVVYKAMNELYPLQGGLGLYTAKNFVHNDVGPFKRWDDLAKRKKVRRNRKRRLGNGAKKKLPEKSIRGSKLKFRKVSDVKRLKKPSNVRRSFGNAAKRTQRNTPVRRTLRNGPKKPLQGPRSVLKRSHG